jgi:hypothetical protein
MRRPPGIAVLRAAWWAGRALRRARAELRGGGLRGVDLPAPPRLRGGDTTVRAVLRARRASCLERALVLQRWLGARGDPRDVVIGTTGPADFEAHAWLDGEAGTGTRFVELARLPP